MNYYSSTYNREFQHKNCKTLFTLHQSILTIWYTEALTGWRVCLTLHHSSPSLHLIKFFRFYSIHQKISGGWRVVKREWALFTSRIPSVYRGVRRKGERWRVKKRLEFYTTHRKKAWHINFFNTRGHIVSCLTLALYCPVLEQYYAKARHYMKRGLLSIYISISHISLSCGYCQMLS